MNAKVVTSALTLLLILIVSICYADEPVKAPDAYVGLGYEWNLAEDTGGIDFSVKLAGRRKVSPVFGLHDDKLLVGVEYMALGTRAQLKDIYGGLGVIWYDDHFGGCATLGTHLSREWIIEATYRATADWDGRVDVSLSYGFNW